MSIIETISDVNNTFLSRRELICNFTGLGGKLKKMEAIDMITKEFKLDGKIIIPIKLQNHVGMPLVTGTFYVYDDEKLAKEHVNPIIFSRLEKAKKGGKEKKEEKPAEEKVQETKAEGDEHDKKDVESSKKVKSKEESDKTQVQEKKPEERAK